MSPQAQPTYEVAAIKLSDPLSTSSGFQLRGNRVVILNQTVETMMAFAYNVQKRQIVDAPAWIDDTHYDVSGYPNVEGEPSVQQMRGMIRALLKDRFQLVVHDEHRQMPVYVLRLGKSGPKLKAATSPDGEPDQTGSHGTSADFHFTNNRMSDFVSFLQSELDRPVVDETGLTSKYDFTLKWSSDLADRTASDAAPMMFTAIQEELGLKLQPGRQLAPIIVVAHVEPPTEN